MKKIVLLFFFLIGLSSIPAQSFIGKLNPYPDNVSKVSVQDTLKILAVMVSFQPDKDGATVGNGKFGTIYSKDYGNSILDPLPHDKAYFESHLEFVKNYFHSVSKGNLTIEYTVLPDTFSVSQTMRNYSPAINSTDFTPLGNFSKEVWETADSMYPFFDFSAFDVFTIFHAGVGRDISLPGSLGNERDLPSVYLSKNALKEIFGSSFEGFNLSSGVISNTMIIPETESREVSGFGGSFLFEISINGLLVASVASHLGLPDLFDTKTGLSAIGRFGLMDGQSIFAYNGTFPPQPSAWEKIELGWAVPITVEPENFSATLTADLAASLSDTVILKIPINSTEYFLVENRNRDVNNDGAIITYISGGDTLTKTFTKDADGFFSFSVDSLEGVVIGVDEYDWALPGFIDDENNFKGGIIIWHIDESIIAANRTTNSINNDKKNRGVEVEEADGIKDIGEQFQTIFGDIVIGEGTYFDYWYQGNTSDLFKNRFGKDTRPSSRANSGANSLITISNFSPIGNRMSFNVAFGDSIIKPIFSKDLLLPSNENNLTVLNSTSDHQFYISSGSHLFRVNSSGDITESLNNFSQFKPASIFTNNVEYTAGAFGDTLNVYMKDGAVTFLGSAVLGEMITSPPVIRKSVTEQVEILVGTGRGKIYKYTLGDLITLQNPQQISVIEGDTSYSIIQIAADDLYYSYIKKFSFVTPLPQESFTGFEDSEGNSLTFSNEVPLHLTLTRDRNGNYISIVLTSLNNFYIISAGKVIEKFNANSGNAIASFALGDLKRNGENYIIFADGSSIKALSLSGASAENFPFEDPLNMSFTNTILTADIEGTPSVEVIFATEDGRIFAVKGNDGKIVDGFPISLGSKVSAFPALFLNNSTVSIAALNQQNNFSAWTISSVAGKIQWSEEFGSGLNSAFTSAADNQNIVNTFFPADKVYNYPNPVYGGDTQIRYYVSEDSKINIKIFDLAGDFVAELNDNARGGFDSETTWNVSGIQSGVYLARVEASGNSGRTETSIIKIAIIK